MEFYDKFVDRFQDLPKESYCQQGKGLIVTYSIQKKMLRGYDAVPLTMLYSNFFIIWFHKKS